MHAVLIACSGSTGLPKGVQSLHMGLVHLLREFTALCPAFRDGSAVFLQSMASFFNGR